MISLAHDLAQALDLLDPVDLFRRTIGEPDDWERRVLLSTCRKQILVCGRQQGKSVTMSVKALHLALTKSGSTILLIAPSLRQSALLFSVVAGIYHKLTGLSDPEAESKLSISFSNKSKIVALPGGASGFDTIRGYSADAVFCEEAVFVPKEVLQACIPMMAVRKDSVLVLLTSASWAAGWVYEIWKNTADETWERTKVTALQNPRVDPVWLADTRREIGERAFKTEFMAEFQDPAKSLFGGALLEAALSDDISIIRW